MSTLVVHESQWGNSRAVAEAVADALPGDVESVDVGAAPSSLPAGVDLLVVGGPTHAFSMSRPSSRRDAARQGAQPGHADTGIREWLEALEPVEGLEVAVFDTRVAKVRRLPGSAARAAARLVSRRHLGRVRSVESFFVGDTAGPLLDGELERARAWAGTLRSPAGR
jgi:hypothetical protein